MATQKKSTAKRSTTATTTRKRSTATGTRKKTPKKRPIRREISGAVLLLLALCTAVGYFTSEGWLIQALPNLIKGLTGYGYLVWAIALIVAGWNLLLHKGRPVTLKTTCTLLFPVAVGSLFHVILVNDIPTIQYWGSGIELQSGGILSGGLADLVETVFGKVASIIIFAAVVVILFGIVFYQQLRTAYENWQGREEYEEIPLPEKPKKAPAPKKQEKVQIDIPLDEASAEKQPGILAGFFRQRGKDQKTPADVLETEESLPTSEPIAEPVPEEPPMPVVHQPSAPVYTPAPVQMEKKSEEPKVFEAVPLTREPEEQQPVGKAEVSAAAAEVTAEINEKAETTEAVAYTYPPLTLLNSGSGGNHMEAGAELRANGQRLAETLSSFGVSAVAGDVIRGPSVTRYEFTLEQGVKLSKITNLQDDIALALGASGVRIAPVPDKISVVGIEVPNRTVTPVLIREVLESDAFTKHKSNVAFAVGRDIGNNNIVGDIAKLPHMLIAGTTGSGKSVCTNALIISMLYKSTPEEVRFIMVDPKMVELGMYNGIPHLLIPVVTDPKKAAGALQWAVYEMMKRYKTFSELGVKKLEEYNELAEKREDLKKMASVVVVIDELADLMLVAAKEVEESICRVAQMGRASGIHLVIATQRPSADVITGLMKANIPSRIAFAVASGLESRIILDNPGAEKLVGRGDMLFAPLGSGKPQRVQGCFISGEEIDRVVNYVKQSGEAQYSDEVMQKIEESMQEREKGSKKDRYDGSTTAEVEALEDDEMYPSAVEVVLETGQASVSMLQRRLKLGYSRAARLVDTMEQRGIVGPFEGSKPRQLLITKAQWQEMQMRRNGAEGVVSEESPAQAPVVDEESLPF